MRGITRSGSGSSPGFIKKIRDPARNSARLKTRYPKLQKYHIYIYTYNLTLIPHFFSLSRLPPSVRHSLSPTLPLPQLSPSLQLTPTLPHSLTPTLRHSLISAQSRLPSLITLTASLFLRTSGIVCCY